MATKHKLRHVIVVTAEEGSPRGPSEYIRPVEMHRDNEPLIANVWGDELKEAWKFATALYLYSCEKAKVDHHAPHKIAIICGTFEKTAWTGWMLGNQFVSVWEMENEFGKPGVTEDPENMTELLEVISDDTDIAFVVLRESAVEKFVAYYTEKKLGEMFTVKDNPKFEAWAIDLAESTCTKVTSEGGDREFNFDD